MTFALLTHVPYPIAITAPDGRFVWSNRAFAELSGFEVDQLAGRNLFEQMNDRRNRGRFQVDHFSRGGVDLLTSWGTLLSLQLQIVRFQIEGVQHLMLTFSTPSTTESPQTSKLESLGAIAGGVAHDLNNILTGILGHVSFLRLALPKQETYQESLAAIEEGARRSASMTQQILGFVRDQDSKSGPVNLLKVVSAGIALVRGALPKNVEINSSISTEPLIVEGDETRLSQLFMNLVVNARDALPDGGKISIELEGIIVDDKFCASRSGLKSGEHARLIMRDNGMGIAPHVQRRMFEPFFTTKRGSGTGLGLATVVSIVDSHHGFIEVESEVGAGTTFSVYLPIYTPEALAQGVAKAAEVPAEEEQVPERSAGGPRVLVVDDEEVVRTVIQRSLEHFGYEVDVALDGADGVSRYRHDPNRYALVVLDMMMPKMAGDEVFRRLKQIDDNVRVLLVSGYSSEGRAQALMEAGALGFIQKPFAVEELAREVKRCLEKPAPVGTRRAVVRDDEIDDR